MVSKAGKLFHTNLWASSLGRVEMNDLNILIKYYSLKLGFCLEQHWTKHAVLDLLTAFRSEGKAKSRGLSACCELLPGMAGEEQGPVLEPSSSFWLWDNCLKPSFFSKQTKLKWPFMAHCCVCKICISGHLKVIENSFMYFLAISLCRLGTCMFWCQYRNH